MAGCGSNNANYDYSNTGSGKNTNSNENSSKISDLEDNIIISGEITERGKLVILAKNTNNAVVDMDFEVEFYDVNGTIGGSDSDSLQAVGANTEVAVEIYSTPDNFDNYKIYIDVEPSDVISYFDKVELTHNNTGKEIAVQVKNNSQDMIEYITVSIVFYKNNKVVGIEEDIESDIKSSRSANFVLNYPYKKIGYDKVDFDSYKVFITEAYSYNW
ncbi:MAG: hypothetical protein PHX04_00550 [Bacilli bacterium]|nr:hypothetical protein [Bacilli bacterium]